MIKANELRIENLVKKATGWNKDGFPIIWSNTIYEVEGIKHDYVSIHDYPHYSGVSGAKLTEICPIPITEEWLVKMGFKEWTGWFYLSLKKLGDEYTLCFAPNENILMLNIGEKTIKYENRSVHQLQNLYFALTGEELIYKP